MSKANANKVALSQLCNLGKEIFESRNKSKYLQNNNYTTYNVLVGKKSIRYIYIRLKQITGYRYRNANTPANFRKDSM